MRIILIITTFLIFIKSSYAQDHTYPYYKSYVDWDAYIIDSGTYKKSEKYQLTHTDIMKEQENTYSDGKIILKIYYSNIDGKQEELRKVFYEWENGMLKKIMSVDLDNFSQIDTSITLFEYNFPIVNEYDIIKGTKILSTKKQYNRDSTMAVEYRYLEDGKLDATIKYSYDRATVKRSFIEDNIVRSETIFQTLDARNTIWYYMDPNNIEELLRDKNYNNMYIFIKSSLNENGQIADKIYTTREGSYVITKNYYKNGRLTYSKKIFNDYKSNDCKEETSVYKYYE